MNAGLATSLSGLNAAGTKLNVAANNIANNQSTKESKNGVETDKVFVPSKVENVSLGGSGGVKSLVTPVEPASFLVSQNSQTGELEKLPDVDLGEQTVDTILAKNAYKANLVTLEAQNETIKQTLDIIS